MVYSLIKENIKIKINATIPLCFINIDTQTNLIIFKANIKIFHTY